MIDSSVSTSFPAQLCFQGKVVDVGCTLETTATELVLLAQQQFFLTNTDHDVSTMQLKLLYKGKRLETGSFDPVFVSRPIKPPRIIILATEATKIEDINSRRADPTIRGFDQEKPTQKVVEKNTNDDWGPLLSKQDKNYKFCRFDVCTRQSFGHRPGDTTPHEFEARKLLIKLATDPGIVAIMKDRELLVGTLGEMDPIDDRLMQQKQQQGVCLLGYNTNGGTRIDLKLRADDLTAFRPYQQLVSTLVHELSHNWVGDHNLLFWTNYGQMMIDYCATHAFGTAGIFVSGQSTGQIAGLPIEIRANMDRVFEYVMEDLRRSMMQHGLDASMIDSLVRQRCNELIQQKGYGEGHLLGGSSTYTMSSDTANSRSMALQAAERRLRENEYNTKDANQKSNGDNKNNNNKER
jgi:hypothetical protein